MDLSSPLFIEDELLINLSKVDPSLTMASSILFSLSSNSVMGITALSPSKPLDTEMMGVLTVTDAEDTSTVRVVLLHLRCASVIMIENILRKMTFH